MRSAELMQCLRGKAGSKKCSALSPCEIQWGTFALMVPMPGDQIPNISRFNPINLNGMFPPTEDKS